MFTMLMFVGEKFLVKFTFFGIIHSVILIQSSEYSSLQLKLFVNKESISLSDIDT